MRHLIVSAAIVCIVFPMSVFALTRDDLSEDAKKLVPEDISTIVRLKDGTEHEGTLVADTVDSVSLRTDKKGVKSVVTFSKDQVASVAAKDVLPILAQNLLEKYRAGSSRKLDHAEYKLAISMFDEYLAQGQDAAEEADMAARRKTLQGELDALEEGMGKVDSRLLSQVLAAMSQYETDTETVKAMAQQYGGIEQPAYAGDAEAKVKFKATIERRQAMLAKLPEIVKSSVTSHLTKKEFPEAAKELDQFVKLWVNVVIPEEARRRGADPKTVATEMDLGFIVELQKTFMRKYLDAGRGQGELPPNYRTPKDMVLVPGGYFLMGRDGAKFGDVDFPLHLVYVESFLIDRFEVKNKDYNEFVARVKKSGDYSFEHPLAPALKDHTSQASKNPALAGDSQPVVGIDWLDAYAYAKSKSKRLPTEAEWEKAARGMRLRKYPWGADDPAKVAVNSVEGRKFLAAEMDRQNPPPPPEKSLMQTIGLSKAPLPTATSLRSLTWPTAELLPPQTLAAQTDGKFKWSGAAVSPYKIFHMGGNAAEWVGDWYDPVFYSQSPLADPKGPENGTIRSFRGGSYLSPDGELLTTWRGAVANEKMAMGCSANGEPMIGLRCVKSIGETTP